MTVWFTAMENNLYEKKVNTQWREDNNLMKDHWSKDQIFESEWNDSCIYEQKWGD